MTFLYSAWSSLLWCLFIFYFSNTIFVPSHMYPENPGGSRVTVSSMNMGYAVCTHHRTGSSITISFFCVIELKESPWLIHVHELVDVGSDFVFNWIVYHSIVELSWVQQLEILHMEPHLKPVFTRFFTFFHITPSLALAPLLIFHVTVKQFVIFCVIVSNIHLSAIYIEVPNKCTHDFEWASGISFDEGVGRGNIQGCVEGLNIGKQTFNPNLA